MTQCCCTGGPNCCMFRNGPVQDVTPMWISLPKKPIFPQYKIMGLYEPSKSPHC